MLNLAGVLDDERLLAGLQRVRAEAIWNSLSVTGTAWPGAACCAGASAFVFSAPKISTAAIIAAKSAKLIR